MMPSLWFFCSIFALHLLLCIHSLPVPEWRASNRYKAAAGWPQKTHPYGLKKTTRFDHTQDTLKEQLHLSGGVYPETVLSWNGTESIWNRPRCGVPDYPTQKQSGISDYHMQKGGTFGGKQRRKRFVVFGGRWDKTDLTYKIMRFPWQLSNEKVRHILQEALRVWSEVTPLKFTEVSSGRADIIIDFTRYWHGDNLPFDGPGGILAHAFFPRTHRAGDIHFDYDESWTVGNSMGTDLLQVAAHEFGHVLGLQHSLVEGAVMSPFYSFSYPLELSDDDKQGIQYLYGPLQKAPPVITETNEIETTVPDPCRTNFDAVSMIRGEMFFFKSRYVWRIRDGQLQAGYPALATRHWRGIPDNIDAAYEDKTGNSWFFQGDSYWVFDAERRITGPDSVRRLGLQVSDIQAALMWGEDKAQKTYLFKSGTYWRFSPLENRVDTAHPRSMQDWRGIPKDIDAAFQDRYGFAHFLSGRQYWKFDPVEVKVLEGYPRYIGMDFFGCPASFYR
ncbi:stromelysin-3 [Oncorhynchus nerka]|uniref:stromelysin-3 n=1 Tax=Oncorhynchus nerka TaxID=8023 RepID=UPI00113075B8|nr:stromelysin-3-like [Oncorhynchus nerka]